jgi:hypothetical protein
MFTVQFATYRDTEHLLYLLAVPTQTTRHNIYTTLSISQPLGPSNEDCNIYLFVYVI